MPERFGQGNRAGIETRDAQSAIRFTDGVVGEFRSSCGSLLGTLFVLIERRFFADSSITAYRLAA